MSYLDQLREIEFSKAPTLPTAGTAESPETPLFTPSGSFGSTHIGRFQKLNYCGDELPELPKALDPDTEAVLRQCFTHIGEDDPVTIAEVLENCRKDPAGCERLLAYIRETSPTLPTDPFPDERITCNQCQHLSIAGVCRVAGCSLPDKPTGYRPNPEQRRWCEGFR